MKNYTFILLLSCGLLTAQISNNPEQATEQSLVKNFSKFEHGSSKSLNQIIVGKSGLLPLRKVPLNLT